MFLKQRAAKVTQSCRYRLIPGQVLDHQFSAFEEGALELLVYPAPRSEREHR
jgi:hypothetical protein